MLGGPTDLHLKMKFSLKYFFISKCNDIDRKVPKQMNEYFKKELLIKAHIDLC